MSREPEAIGETRFDLKYGMGGLSHQALLTKHRASWHAADMAASWSATISPSRTNQRVTATRPAGRRASRRRGPVRVHFAWCTKGV